VKVYNKILSSRKRKGAGFFVLIDPDKQEVRKAIEFASMCNEADVDALLIGGSLLFAPVFDELVKGVKAECRHPVIIFPGSSNQISRYADAILFLSLVSGRNPNSLIGEQVVAAPIIKSMNLEVISTAYMLIESGSITSAQFLSNTTPIPRDKPDIAKAHALAAEYLGMRLVYLETGSGAKYSVPESLIQEIHGYVSIPLIVGGGIRTPEEAQKKVEAGAGFIVIGNILEAKRDIKLLSAFADAVHNR
jgi:putative glycerol-1-phosphate prenyltransferase